jgi:hypothetical protein
MTTIGESISRIRTILKIVTEDAFITDREVYSILSKYAKFVIRRQDNEKKLMQYEGLFEFLPFEELEEVSKIEAGCGAIQTKCTIMRTEKKLPNLMSGAYGPLIRKVFSIDASASFEKTTLNNFISIANSTNYKYNTTKYFYIRNEHVYFPNWDGEGVMIEGLWDDTLDGRCIADNDDCTLMQDRPFPMPDYLFSEIEQLVEQEFTLPAKLPASNNGDDSQNIFR